MVTHSPSWRFNCNLDKDKFLETVRLRYQLPIPSLPMQWPSGENVNTQNTNPCKKGGFVNHRHKLRDITAALLILEEVYHDDAIEATLQPITDCCLVLSITNTNEGSR